MGGDLSQVHFAFAPCTRKRVPTDVLDGLLPLARGRERVALLDKICNGRHSLLNNLLLLLVSSVAPFCKCTFMDFKTFEFWGLCHVT